MASRRIETLVWLGVLAIVVAATGLVPMPWRTILWGAIADSAHAPVFAVVALLLLRLSRLWLDNWNPYAVAFAGVVFLGGATEAAQFLSARDADPWDLGMDLVGGAVALSLCYTREPGWPRGRAWAVRGVAILALCATFLPLVWCLHAYRVRGNAFPRLIAFESRAELIFFETAGTRLSYQDGSGTVVFLAGGRQYPRFGVTEVEPDWRGYSTLVAEVHNSSDSLVKLHLRIHDFPHDKRYYDDRFNMEVTLHPGDNRIEIPVATIEDAPRSRRLDLSQVKNVTFFLVRPERNVTLRFDDVRLVR
jgi:hypothetical protein